MTNPRVRSAFEQCLQRAASQPPPQPQQQPPVRACETRRNAQPVLPTQATTAAAIAAAQAEAEAAEATAQAQAEAAEVAAQAEAAAAEAASWAPMLAEGSCLGRLRTYATPMGCAGFPVEAAPPHRLMWDLLTMPPDQRALLEDLLRDPDSQVCSQGGSLSQEQGGGVSQGGGATQGDGMSQEAAPEPSEVTRGGGVVSHEREGQPECEDGASQQACADDGVLDHPRPAPAAAATLHEAVSSERGGGERSAGTSTAAATDSIATAHNPAVAPQDAAGHDVAGRDVAGDADALPGTQAAEADASGGANHQRTSSDGEDAESSEVFLLEGVAWGVEGRPVGEAGEDDASWLEAGRTHAEAEAAEEPAPGSQQGCELWAAPPDAPFTQMPLSEPPLTQPPLTQPPYTQPADCQPCTAKQAGTKRPAEDGVAACAGAAPSHCQAAGSSRWPAVCPRCNGDCGDIHLALARPLPFTRKGPTPDVLGLGELNPITLWRETVAARGRDWLRSL